MKLNWNFPGVKYKKKKTCRGSMDIFWRYMHNAWPNIMAWSGWASLCKGNKEAIILFVLLFED